jgi:hypothetical protein
MNAKEKAEELINKMYLKIPSYYDTNGSPFGEMETTLFSIAKEMALIAVDEILDSYTSEKSIGFFILDKIIPYWVEVKQEIISF